MATKCGPEHLTTREIRDKQGSVVNTAYSFISFIQSQAQLERKKISAFNWNILYYVISSSSSLSSSSPSSSRKLSCDNSITSSKASSLQSAIYCFLFQVPLSSTRRCLRLVPRLYVRHIFTSLTCVKRQFQRNLWPIQLDCLHVIVCRMFL